MLSTGVMTTVWTQSGEVTQSGKNNQWAKIWLRTQCGPFQFFLLESKEEGERGGEDERGPRGGKREGDEGRGRKERDWRRKKRRRVRMGKWRTKRNRTKGPWSRQLLCNSIENSISVFEFLRNSSEPWSLCSLTKRIPRKQCPPSWSPYCLYLSAKAQDKDLLFLDGPFCRKGIDSAVIPATICACVSSA